MLFKTFALLALAIGATANVAAPPQPRTNAEALARGLPILNPRHGKDHGGDDGGYKHHPGKPGRPSAKPTPTQAGPDPDFAKTCPKYKIKFEHNQPPTLHAKCKNNRGDFKYSKINLNKCIKLGDDGQLTCAGGGFVGKMRRRRGGRDERSLDAIEARGGGGHDHDHGKPWNNNWCTSCEVDSEDTIKCTCPVKGGNTIEATYTLGDCISNNNGRLTCKGCEGDDDDERDYDRDGHGRGGHGRDD